MEKRLSSKLLVGESVEKIMEVDSHIGAAMSGLVADARTLVDHARVEAQNHRCVVVESTFMPGRGPPAPAPSLDLHTTRRSASRP